MIKFKKTIDLVVFAILVVTCLTACGSSSENVSGADRSGDSVSAAAKGPIYLPTLKTSYNKDGNASARYEYDYDEHGNTIRFAMVILGTDGKDVVIETTNSDFDEYGYNSKTVASETANVILHEYKIENGHAVEGISDNEGIKTIIEYKYYEDGKLESQKATTDNETNLIEYDEKGLPIRYFTEGGYSPGEQTYTWTFDENGRPASFIYSSDLGGKTTRTEYTTECDKNGNVVAIYKAGKLSTEIEYEKIDDPSNYAWIRSWYDWH